MRTDQVQLSEGGYSVNNSTSWLYNSQVILTVYSFYLIFQSLCFRLIRN